MKSTSIGFIALIIFCISSTANAGDQGTLEKRDFRVGDCKVRSMTVKYKIGTLMGEPVVKGSFKWEADQNLSINCLPSDLVIWLKIRNSAGAYGYIRLAPTVPAPGAGYGFNTPGSPDWDEFICGFKGSRSTSCLSGSDAKTLYKNGSIVDFELSK